MRRSVLEPISTKEKQIMVESLKMLRSWSSRRHSLATRRRDTYDMKVQNEKMVLIDQILRSLEGE